MRNPLLVNAAELLRRPGSEKILELHPTLDELGIGGDDRFAADSKVDVRLRLEALTDGIVVDGTVTAPWVGTCRRCLEPTSGTSVSDVHELYQHERTDPDAFEIVGDQIDLAQMVRELVLLDAPHTPLCRPDCAGLCPTCGADLNLAACGCAPVVLDNPWAALDQLKGNLGSQ